MRMHWFGVAVAVLCGCSQPAGSGFRPGLGGDEDDGAPTGGVLTTGVSAGADASSSGGTPDPGTTQASDASDPSSDASTTGGLQASSSGDGGSTAALDDSGGSSSSSTSDGDVPGDALDPDLDVPEDGEVCDTPGHLGECPGIQVCRFHTTEQGLCESCDTCGNLGAFCNEGTDCDILFSCFENRCTNFCSLGTFECGPVEDCLDVGHPTHGVCDPSAI